MFLTAVLSVLILIIALLFLASQAKVSLQTRAKRSIVVFLVPSVFDLVSMYTRMVGWWEGWLHFLFDLLLENQHGVIVDIGANIGCHSLILAQYENHHVWAFEPQDVPCTALRKSIAANKINNIEVFQIALGAVAGDTSISPITRLSLGSGAGRIGKGGEQVYMDTLDHIWQERNHPVVSFVKIDVEGFEKEVLKGASECLASCPPILFEDWGTSTQLYLRKHFGYTDIIRLRHPWLGFATRDFIAFKRIPQKWLNVLLSLHHEVV